MDANEMLAQVKTIVAAQSKRGRRKPARSVLVRLVMQQLNISNVEARCLISAAQTDRQNNPTFSSKANQQDWLMLYALVNAGYEKTAWGVIRKALGDAIDQFPSKVAI